MTTIIIWSSFKSINLQFVNGLFRKLKVLSAENADCSCSVPDVQILAVLILILAGPHTYSPEFQKVLKGD